MKVRIVACSNDDYWYANNVGQVVEVTGEDEHNYYIPSSVQPHEVGIAKEDVEILEGSGEACRRYFGFH